MGREKLELMNGANSFQSFCSEEMERNGAVAEVTRTVFDFCEHWRYWFAERKVIDVTEGGENDHNDDLD